MAATELPMPSEMPTNLFVSHEGKPIQFRMIPCVERVRLQPYVRAGGGKISNAPTESQTIKLVPPGHKTDEENGVSSHYLWTCIRAKRMISMSDYHVPIHTKAPLEPPTSAEANANISISNTKGRNAFTAGDDQTILDFMKKTRPGDFRSRADLFRHLSEEFGSQHTWESIKNRVNKHIIPRLSSLLAPDECKRVSSLFMLNSSSDSDSDSSDSEESSPLDRELPMKLSLKSLPTTLSNYLAFGEVRGWTHSQSAILLWMTSGQIDAAKIILESKDCSTVLWDPILDNLLTSGDNGKSEAMIREYGVSESLKRLHFLEDCDLNEDAILEDLLIK